MPAYVNVIDSTTNNAVTVDDNKQLAVGLNLDPTKAGFAKICDADGNPLATEENSSLAVSMDNPLFFEQVDGSSVNTNKWIQSTSGMTISQAGGFLTLNANSTTTANAYAIISSIQQLPFYGNLPVEVTFSGMVTAAAQANVTFEAGLGTVSGISAPTDGAYIRVTPAGAFQCVTNYGGAEQVTTVTGGSVMVGVKVLFSIVVVEDHVQFFVNDTMVADVQNPPSNSYPFSAGHQPIFVRVYNGTGAPTTAQPIKIGQVNAVQTSMSQQKSWEHVLADMGLSAYQSPALFTQTANRPNSTTPSSATLSNTAAGYTTLGGDWQCAAPGAAQTDYALFAFQVPTPYRLRVFGVRICASVIGVAVVTSALLDWALGINASAVSLATTDGATTWAPRRIPLGSQNMPALAALGFSPADLVQMFTAPLVVDAGRFLHVILRVPIGAATSSLIYRGSVFIDGQFE